MPLIDSVNWITGEITVLRASMPINQASPEIRDFDSDEFLGDLKDEETSADGRPWPDTQEHKVEYTIAGIQYAQAIEIIPPYFITFEDGQYGVNVLGSNNNVLQVTTQNQVRVATNNSAGNVYPPITEQETRDAMELTSTSGKPSIDDKVDNAISVAAGLYSKR